MSEMTTQLNKYVTFKSGNEYFGLKIQYVNEIIVFQEVTEIPESEDYIKGLINLRGKIIPVIDVRIRFKQEPIEYNDRTCIIVINVKDTVVGLIVEKIAEVVEIKEEICSNCLVTHPEVFKIAYTYIYKMVIRQFERLCPVICISSGVRLKICPIPCTVIPAQLYSKFSICSI